MIQASRLLRNRLSRMLMSTTTTTNTTAAQALGSSTTLGEQQQQQEHQQQVFKSESELRAMNHEQLLTYALAHISAPSQPAIVTTNRKRKETDVRDANNVDVDNCIDDQTLSNNEDINKTNIINGEDQLDKMDTKKAKRRRKEFDMTRYGQRMIALKLNYQGWKFHGFAAQVTNDNTVENHLFEALLKTRLIESIDSCHYSRAGRTDVGVSALDQIIGLRVRSAIVPPSSGEREIDYVKTINGALPNGIRVMAWSPVCDGSQPSVCVYDRDHESLKEHWRNFEKQASSNENDLNGAGDGITTNVGDKMTTRRERDALFSARFDAVSRSYKYFFVRADLNIKAMMEAAKHFEGRHDFRNFCRFDEHVTNFERVLTKVTIRRCADDDKIVNRTTTSSTASDLTPMTTDINMDNYNDDEMSLYYVYVEGQAFLWHQVRCMVAVLLDVGRSLEQPSLVYHMLNDVKLGHGPFANGRPHYRLASPTPLLLFKCSYPPSVLYFDAATGPSHTQSLRRADDHLAQCWTEETCRGAVIKQMLMDNDAMLSKVEENIAHTKRRGDDLQNEMKVVLEHDAQNRCRQPNRCRQLVPEGMGTSINQKHIPYHQRSTDDPVTVKMERASRKKQNKIDK